MPLTHPSTHLPIRTLLGRRIAWSLRPAQPVRPTRSVRPTDPAAEPATAAASATPSAERSRRVPAGRAAGAPLSRQEY